MTYANYYIGYWLQGALALMRLMQDERGVRWAEENMSALLQTTCLTERSGLSA